MFDALDKRKSRCKHPPYGLRGGIGRMPRHPCPRERGHGTLMACLTLFLGPEPRGVGDVGLREVAG